MSLLCINACANPTDIPALDPCNLELQKFAGEFFAFIKCDYQFTDITDTAEWTAAIAAGDIWIAPPGFWDKPAPAQTTVDVACGLKENVQEGYTLNYVSNLVATDLSDQASWKELRNGYRNWRVVPIACAQDSETGYFYVEDSYLTAVTVVGESPGFRFSWTAPPDEIVGNTNTSNLSWAFSMFIPRSNAMCRRLIPGLYNTLKNV